MKELLQPILSPADVFLLVEGCELICAENKLEVAPSLWIAKVDDEFLGHLAEVGVSEPRQVVGDARLLVHSSGTTSATDLLRSNALVNTIALVSSARAVPAATIIVEKDSTGKARSTTPYRHHDRPPICWGHYGGGLSGEDIKNASALLPQVSALQLPEKFSRVCNALSFYTNGLHADNPDFALIAFTTSLESLYSTVEQEISFRLSLRMATFLNDEKLQREETFKAAREVYRVRSKIVHGAAILRGAEEAAIYLVEEITPSAEELARRSLLRILEKRLESVFDNSERVNTLFDMLLFRDSVDEVLKQMKS